MRWAVILAILYLWTAWEGRYALWFAEGDKVKLDPEERNQYTVDAGKPALPLVEGINNAIRSGDIPANVVIYGLGMEHYRFYADFELIGALYGYASHKEFMAAVEAGGARGLREWLRQYNVSFLAVDQWTVDFSAHDYAMWLPTDDPQWPVFFSKVIEGNQNALYRVRN
jgi:hypothetical protein